MLYQLSYLGDNLVHTIVVYARFDFNDFFGMMVDIEVHRIKDKMSCLNRDLIPHAGLRGGSIDFALLPPLVANVAQMVEQRHGKA
jgi:hypothetical protein